MANVGTSTVAYATQQPTGSLVFIASDGTACVLWTDGTNQKFSYASSPYSSWTTTTLITGLNMALGGRFRAGSDNIDLVTGASGTVRPNYYPLTKISATYSLGTATQISTTVAGTSAVGNVMQYAGQDPQGRHWIVCGGASTYTTSRALNSPANSPTGTWTSNISTTQTGDVNLPAGDQIGNYLLKTYWNGTAIQYHRLDTSVATLGAWSTAATIPNLTGSPNASSRMTFRAISSTQGLLVYSTGSGIYAQTYTPGTDTWSTATQLSTNASDRHPAIATDGAGNAWVLWCSFAAANSYALVYKKWDGVVWDGAATTLVASGTNIANPNAGYGNQTIGVTYTQGTANPFTVGWTTFSSIITRTRTVPSSAALSGQDWYSAGWRYRKQITLDHTKVGSTLTDFPVLISLTDVDLKTVASGGKVQNGSGFDIIFADAGASIQLDHEIESYTASTGAILMWVRVPALSASVDTVIYCYFGNSTISSSLENKGTWESHFKRVYHLGNGTTLSVADSTSNAQNGTNNGATAAAGIIDGAASFNGTSNSIDVPMPGLPSGAAAWSMGAWVKIPTLPTSGNSRVVAGFGAFATNQNAQIEFNYLNASFLLTIYGADIYGPASSVVAGNAYYLAATYDGTTLTFYINGSSVGTSTVTLAITLSFADIGVGDNYFSGIIDEVHWSNSARSSGWVLTEYNNQSAPTSFATAAATTVIGQMKTRSVPSSVALSRAATSPYAVGVLAKTPGGYWRLDEVNGTSVYDQTSNLNHGSFVGTPPSLNQAGAILGESDPAMKWTAAGAITLPTALNANGWSALSVEVWIIPTTSAPTTGNFYNFAVGPRSGNTGWVFFIDSTSTLGWIVGNGTTNVQTTGAYTFTPGKVYHLVATYDGSHGRIYINGGLFTTSGATMSGPISNSGVPSLNSNDASFFPGTLDEGAIYPLALSDVQILNNYRAGNNLPASVYTPPTDGFGIYEGFAPTAANQAAAFARLDQIAAAGFKLVMNYQSLNAHMSDLLAYADHALAAGLKIIWNLWPPDLWKTGTISTSYPLLYADSGNLGTDAAFTPWFVNQVKGHAATWGYYVGDEVLASDHVALKTHTDLIASTDSTHPRLLVNSCTDVDSVSSGTNPFADCCEVLGDDDYPVGDPNNPTIAWEATTIGLFDSSVGRSPTMVLQAHSLDAYRHDGSPWPTEAQMRGFRDDACSNMAARCILWYSFFDIENDANAALRWNTLIEAVFSLRAALATAALLATLTRTIPASAALIATKSRSIGASLATSRTLTRTVGASLATLATSTRTAPASVALLSSPTRTVGSSATLTSTLTRSISASAALLLTRTRSLGASVALGITSTRQVSSTGALLSTSTRTVPASGALQGQATRVIPTSATLSITRVIPTSTALSLTQTRTIAASSALLLTQTRQVGAGVALIATMTRTVPATGALQGQSSRSIPATGALSISRVVPASAAFLLVSNRVVPASATLALTGTATRTIPLTSALLAASSRNVGASAALGLSNVTRTVPVTTAILRQASRSILASTPLQALLSRQVAASVAALAVANRSIVASGAMLATLTRTVTSNAALVVPSTSTRTILATAALLSTASRNIAVSTALGAFDVSRQLGTSAVLLQQRNRSITANVALVATTTRIVTTSAALLSQASRNVPASFASLAIKTRSIGASGALVSTFTRMVTTDAALSLLGTKFRSIPTSATLSGGSRVLPASSALSLQASRSIPGSAALLVQKTRVVLTSMALSVTSMRAVASSAAVSGTNLRAVPVSVVLIGVQTRSVVCTVSLAFPVPGTQVGIPASAALQSTSTRFVVCMVALLASNATVRFRSGVADVRVRSGTATIIIK